MALSTTEKKKAAENGKSDQGYDKKERIAELKEKHAALFAQEGVENPVFIPKLAYVPKGKTEKHLAFFPSEMEQKADTYTEFVSSEYISEDPERRLWKLEHNPHYEEEYDKTEPHRISGYPRYLVPIGELTEITLKETAQKEITFDEEGKGDPAEDLPMKDMTIRDYMAIHMRVPCSDKSFINETIEKYKP